MPKSFPELFEKEKPVIAMVHTGPSPGVPGFVCVDSAVERAIAETEVYVSGGVDGILIENMRDFPCVHERNMGPEVAAFMTRVASAVKRRARQLPVGIQILFQANKTAIAVAVASGCDFIRAEAWTHAHISDKGIAEASAGDAVRYRKHIDGSHVAVFADVKKKHASHAWTQDLSVSDVARIMELHQADGVVVTGSDTGVAPPKDDLMHVADAIRLPVLIGSGITPENLSTYYHLADGFIVGSALKENGHWHAPVSEERVVALVTAADRARAAHQSELPRN